LQEVKSASDEVYLWGIFGESCLTGAPPEEVHSSAYSISIRIPSAMNNGHPCEAVKKL
jgi:hypothetical protein